MSHIALFKLAKEKDLDYIVIVEDDIKFTNMELFQTQLKKFLDNKIQYDVLFLGGNLLRYPPYRPVGDFAVRAFNCQTTIGYVVKKHFYDIIIENFEVGLSKLLEYPEEHRQYSCDIYWKCLQQIYSFYYIMPPTITQLPVYSDIENKVVNYDHLMLDTNKKWWIKRYIRNF